MLLAYQNGWQILAKDMATSGNANIEILVHTTAPSRGPDDTKYRALAQAYLHFEPAERVDLHQETEGDSTQYGSGLAESQLREELVQSAQEERESEASYQPIDEPESWSAIYTQEEDNNRILQIEVASSQLSFGSVQHNLDSPAIRFTEQPTHRRPSTPAGSQKLGDSWVVPLSAIADSYSEPEKQIPAESQELQNSHVAPQSTVADSQPEVGIRQDLLSSPGTVLEGFLLRLQQKSGNSQSTGESLHAREECTPLPVQKKPEISSIPETYQSSPERATSSVQLPSLSLRRRARTSSPEILSSNLPSTQGPFILLKRKRSACDHEDHGRSSSAPVKIVINSPLFTTDRSEHLSKRLCVQNTPGLVESIGTDIGKSVEATFLQPADASTKDTEVATPSPIVESSKATEVATPSPSIRTSIYANKLEIHVADNRKFPRSSTGDLLPESFITPHLQLLAGRMPLDVVYCPADQKRDLRPMERGHWYLNCKSFDAQLRMKCWHQLADVISKGMVGWGVWCTRNEEVDYIKVYCWGKIVEYVYALLIIASRNKIKGAGARWIGGDGQAIITMPT